MLFSVAHPLGAVSADYASDKASLERMYDCPVFVAGTSEEEYARSVLALSPLLDPEHIHRVRCERKEPGWYGALACNQLICREAVKHFDAHPAEGREIYMSLEAQARPALRFSLSRLREVVEAFRRGDEDIVHVSVVPLPFLGAPRTHVRSHIYRQHWSAVQFSTALLCSRAFAEKIQRRRLEDINKPFDVLLAAEGHSKFVMYPAAFMRGPGQSRASSCLQLDIVRPIMGNVHVFVLGEFLCHYCVTFGVFLLATVVGAVAWRLARRL